MIKINDRFEIKESTWGGGELNIELVVINLSISLEVTKIYLMWEENSRDIERLIIIDEILSRNSINYELIIPYMPYSRQDRPEGDLGCNSLYAMSKVINSLSHSKLMTYDIHNIATLNYFRDAENISKIDIIRSSSGLMNRFDCFISPDAGAYKEAISIGDRYNKPVYCANKKRDSEGVSIEFNHVIVGGRALVIDDICDGGRTFIELGKKIKVNCLDLYVTHGLFTRGLQELRKYYKNIYTLAYTSEMEIKIINVGKDEA